MKKSIVSFILVLGALFLVQSTYAQRFAYVDTKYILEKLPDYKAAQQKLDDQAATWQKEIDTKNETLKKMYTKYQAEEFFSLFRIKYLMPYKK